MTPLSILLAGLLLGVLHATESDHLAAVATLAAGRAGAAHAVRQAIAWGIGHALTLMAFAGLMIVLHASVPPRLEQGLETAVGVVLVLLGADLIRRWRAARSVPPPSAAPGGPARSSSANAERTRWPLRAFGVGTLHGLAGSSALVVMAAATSPATVLGVGYIAVFGLGAILGMAALSLAVAWPLRWAASGVLARRGFVQRASRVASALIGAASCTLGVLTVVRASWP